MSSDTKLKHTSHENAVAADIFDYFCNANTMKHILGLHREICEILNLKPNRFPEFYPKFKHMLSSSWKAQAFFKKFDVRASLSEYEKGFACKSTKVLIIGAGPCGLRAAIESQLLGAKVVVLEKRDRITRNNVVHLWPFVIEDLKALGGKKFYGKFCAGSIDHISIRQLQCMLLKMALCLGVEIHESVEFKELLEPTTTENSEKIGWRASVSPVDHPVSEYEFDCLIGADGRRNTLSGFTRKEFRGKMALAITANFINRKTEEEAAVPEISGVSYIFRQKFFQDMLEHTGVDLENIVYYKDETHYFVMTAKKQSLLEKGVLKTDNYDVNKLLALDNMDMTALYNYAKEAAQYATNNALPFYDFALNHYGNPDVALFDFTSVYAADNASHVRVRMGHKLLIQLVGDSLIEPFWPTGSGIARGFLSVLDAAWAIKMWAADYDIHPMTIVTERESIYRLLAQTTPENLNNNLSGYTINPRTRYKTLNRSSFSSLRVRKLYTSDKSKSEKSIDGDTRQSKVTTMPPEVLLRWAKGGAINVRELVTPEHLASLLRRYRPDLLSFDIPDEAVYSVLEKYFQIDPLRSQDETKIVNYLSKIYHTFKGELPHVSRESDYYNALKREKKIFSNPPALNLSHPKLPDDRRSRKRRVSHNDFPTQGPIRSYPYETLTDAANKDNDDRKDTVKSEKRIPDWKFTTRQRNLSGTEPTTSDMGSKDTGTDKKHDPSSIYKRMPESYTRQNRRPVVRDHQIGDGLKRPGGQSKPKDLLRSVGKINKEDWNVKEIEKKIEENRMGKPVPKAAEKVPKWDKEQFLRSKRRLTTTSVPDEKWQAVDETIIKLDLKLRDSGRPDQGTNKVADLATMFVKKDEPEPVNNNTTTVDAPKNSWQGTKIAKVDCAACNRRVFAAESVIADGLQLHKTCFRCAICKAALRPGGYTFDRDDSRLYCLRHGERIRTLDNAIYTPASIQGDEPLVILPSIKTPERLSSIDVQEGGEIDEDEWTDRNFLASGTSGADKSSDEDSSADTYSDAESYTEEIAERASTPYALDMHGLHRQMHYVSDDSYGDDDFSDGVESSEKDSCSRFREAREARRQEVPQAKIPQQQTDSSEVESEEESSESSERSSATAVSTDSEFEEEVPTAPDPPAITVTIAPIEEPKVFQSREYPLNRARSSGGIASKRALELKRRYLLGESNQPAVRKSDSTSRLDTKLETFQETISEFQKLLNPAPLPVTQPTSKPIAFQSYFDKTSMPDVVLNVRKEPDLLAKADTPLLETEVKKEENSSPEQKEPVEISNIESSSDTESSVTETLTKSVPRVEVHDEVGELIQLDSLMIIPSEESKDDKTTVTQPTQSSSTPIPARDTDSSDSCKYATLPLTDTEWEWAADNTVLEDCTLDESRCQRNVNKKNPRTLSSPKLVHDAKNISAISSHVCGRTSPTIVYSNALDHFQFADEGEQDINPVSNPTNDGYMELVDDGYIDYSPDNDRSMSYILKNSEVCQPMFKEEEAPEDKTPVAERIIADDIVEKELCKLTNTKSEPALSPVSLIPTQEKVLEIKREREQQTEVVRRLVLDRLGKSPMDSRKSYRKPRQLPVSTPPPVPPPMNSEPPVMPTLPPRPALPVNPYPANVPEEPKHNRIMDGLSNFLSKITILNSSRNNNVSGTLPVSEAPPVPPLPAQYCPQSTSEIRPRHNEHPISEQQASAVAELVQVSAQQDAHKAMLAADRRRTRNSTAD